MKRTSSAPSRMRRARLAKAMLYALGVLGSMQGMGAVQAPTLPTVQVRPDEAPTDLPGMTVNPPIDWQPIYWPPYEAPFVDRLPSGGGISKPAETAKEQRTEDKTNKAGCSGQGEVSGNPVVLSTGNKVEPEIDFAAGGEMGLYLGRTYNAFWSGRGLFGTHWLSNLDYSLVLSDNTVWAQRPDGRRIKFLYDAGSGHYLEERASPIAFVVRNGDGGFTLYNENNGIEQYNADGYIIERRNEHGVAWSFIYSGKYLQQVTHSSGRTIKLTWNDGVVTEVTDPAGSVYRYGYTSNVFGSGPGYGRLASTTLPGTPGTTIAYHYEDSRFAGGLTGKSFNGVRYSTFGYDAEGRATSTEHAGGVERYSFSYAVQATETVTPPPKPSPPGGFAEDEPRGFCTNALMICYMPRAVASGGRMAVAASTDATTTIPSRIAVTETSPLGRVTTYVYVDDKLVEVSGQATARCPASYKEKTYDANGYEDIVSDFADNMTDFDYDAQGHLLKKIEAVGTEAERTTTYAWDAAHNRLLGETVAGDRETRYEYADDGRVSRVTVVDLTAHGQGRAQVTTYAYVRQSNGLISQMVVDGHLPGSADAIAYAYSPEGDLLSMSNGLGHQTTYAGYNALGLPGRVTGPNGEIVEYSYDARGRVLQRRDYVNGAWQVTEYAYDGTGQMAWIRQPDGVMHYYAYDAALRLVEEAQPRSSGGYERTRYQYNAASQVVRTEVMQTP